VNSKAPSAVRKMVFMGIPPWDRVGFYHFRHRQVNPAHCLIKKRDDEGVVASS
jgi:hypothetical protein